MNLIKKFFTEFTLLQRVMWAMGLSLPMALLLQYLPDTNTFYISTVSTFDVIGTMFINSLKMLVIPIVLVSMICGVTSMKDMSQLGSFAGRTMAFYVFTTFLAVSFSLVIAVTFFSFFGTTIAVPEVQAATDVVKEAQSIGQMLQNIIPSNLIVAMYEGNMLAIIFTALMIGISITVLGKEGRAIASWFEDWNKVLLKWIELLMLYFAPIGVFALLSKALGTQNIEVFISLTGFFFLTLFILLFHGFVTMGAIFKFTTGLNYKMFLTKARPVIQIAVSTSSSSATLPVTMRTLEERMGVNNSVASFTAPMGSTINMDGTAIMQGVATVFLATLFGIDLTMGDYINVVIISVIASIGTAGVPGVGLVMLTMVLHNVGVPVEGIALLIGIDRLLDMVRTAVNIMGDMTVTMFVAKSTGELNVDIFNDPNAGEVDTHVQFNKESLHE
jgi:Na+/H+-dicarboxylate symporter